MRLPVSKRENYCPLFLINYIAKFVKKISVFVIIEYFNNNNKELILECGDTKGFHHILPRINGLAFKVSFSLYRD